MTSQPRCSGQFDDLAEEPLKSLSAMQGAHAMETTGLVAPKDLEMRESSGGESNDANDDSRLLAMLDFLSGHPAEGHGPAEGLGERARTAAEGLEGRGSGASATEVGNVRRSHLPMQERCSLALCKGPCVVRTPYPVTWNIDTSPAECWNEAFAE